MKNAEVVKLLYKNATSTGHTCGICSHIAKQKKEAVYRNLNCQPISSIFVHKDAADTYERVRWVPCTSTIERSMKTEAPCKLASSYYERRMIENEWSQNKYVSTRSSDEEHPNSSLSN
ncbi:hypothetical protein JG687_00008128 [Phytophthora cactorum]|uniref:Uncharacterized protein n=1 Tax=Phytophthora cactorum TaxID=29920 RepID=A0A8T1UET6_9STRA|nr:hypothetical protein JG687_00008128 [Phytophthora cactorum]